tara:strand:+ start:5868 stop:6557 length:690 start_codon:yes stop_codon:yes gene_type:complete
MNGTQTEILQDCNVAVIRGDVGACSWVYQLKRLDYDRGMLDRIIPYIDKDAAVLDIGAFVGSHTVEYLKHAKCVMSFEPNPSAFACLSYNCPKAIRVNMALGNGFAKRYWTRIYPNCGASYLSDEPTYDCLTVQVRPLESFMLPSRIGYIKMDAEGEEVAIIKGAYNIIAQNKPTMCIEINNAALNRTGTSSDELITILHNLGYRTEPIWPGCDSHEQYDLLAIHRDCD